MNEQETQKELDRLYGIVRECRNELHHMLTTRLINKIVLEQLHKMCADALLPKDDE